MIINVSLKAQNGPFQFITASRAQEPHLVLRMHPHAPQGVLVEPLKDVPPVAEAQQAGLRQSGLQDLGR